MTDKSKPDTHDAGQPLSAAGEGHTGESKPQDEGNADPTNPASKPQGTQRDQEKTMESEGQPVQLPNDAGDLPASTDSAAEREREAKLARDGSGF
jgi:hypothetical protein